MLVLDENLPDAQRLQLRSWRIPFRVIGVDLATEGTPDENVLSLLHHLPQPTFFSLDRDYYRPAWRHSGYGLVWLEVRARQSAEYIRRFLRHAEFDAQAARLGIVARVQADGILVWRLRRSEPEWTPWPQA